MSKLIVRIVLALILVALAWIGISAVNKSLQNAIMPLRQANQLLSTQISDLLHPTPTILPDPVTIIREVRSLARLETIQYSVEKVITGEINSEAFAFLVKDRLLFVAHGTVLAGVDLSKLEPDDLWVDQGVLNVRLPAAEVFIAALDNEKSYVFERDTSIFRQADPNLETLVRQAAEQEIKKAALEDGILELAQQNAETYLTRFFLALGYADVIFTPPES